jgi:DNA-binding YbaB/EbfC family protein
MTKRSFHNKPKKKTASPNDMLGQVQKMQEDMATAQAALESETVSVTAGGGAITVVITGHQRLQSIAINPELLDPEEVDFLQDMLVAGVNAAIEQSQALAAQRMEGITGGIGGMDGLLGGLGLG